MLCPSYQPPHRWLHVSIGPRHEGTVVAINHRELTVTFGVLDAVLSSPWLSELKPELVSRHKPRADGYIHTDGTQLVVCLTGCNPQGTIDDRHFVIGVHMDEAWELQKTMVNQPATNMSLWLLIIVGVPDSQPVPDPLGVYKKDSFLPVPTNNCSPSPNSRFKIEPVKCVCRGLPISFKSILHLLPSPSKSSPAANMSDLPNGPGPKVQSPTSTGGVIAKSQRQAYPLDPQPLSSKTRYTASTKVVETAASYGTTSMMEEGGGVTLRSRTWVCQTLTTSCFASIREGASTGNCGLISSMGSTGRAIIGFPTRVCLQIRLLWSTMARSICFIRVTETTASFGLMFLNNGRLITRWTFIIYHFLSL